MIKNKHPFPRTMRQIYEKFEAKSAAKRQTIGITHLRGILDKLGVDKPKGILFAYYIEELLHSNSKDLNYIDRQIIVIKKNNPVLQSYISKSNDVFPKLKAHFIEHEILIELMRSTYYVNPFIISSLKYDELKTDTKVYFEKLDIDILKQEYIERYCTPTEPPPPLGVPQ